MFIHYSLDDDLHEVVTIGFNTSNVIFRNNITLGIYSVHHMVWYGMVWGTTNKARWRVYIQMSDSFQKRNPLRYIYQCPLALSPAA